MSSRFQMTAPVLMSRQAVPKLPKWTYTRPGSMAGEQAA